MKYTVSIALLSLLFTGCIIPGSSRPDLDVGATTEIKRTIWEGVRSKEYMPLVIWSDTLVLTRELGDRFGRIFPMLLYEEGESSIPARYQQLSGPEEASGYHPWQVAEYSFLDIGWSRAKQAEILDVLGSWLKDFENEEVSLQGGYSSEEGESEAVAGQRTRNVRDYLVRVWEVDPARVRILPPEQLARPGDHVLAQQEARTVRIYPSATYFLNHISFNTTRHPGFIPVGLRIRLDGADRKEWIGAELLVVSGEDTLTRSRLPFAQPHPDISPGNSGEYLIDEYAIWTIPGDVRYLQNPLRMSAVLTRSDGTTVQTNEVPIFITVVETGKHREITGAYESSLMADDGFGFPEFQNEFREWLGTGIRETHPIRFKLGSFSFNEPALTPLHMSVVDRNIKRLRTAIESDTGRRWRMKVVASVDAIEWDEVDRADIDRIARTMNVTSALAQGVVIDGGIRPHLYFPSRRIDSLRSGPDGAYRDLVHVMFEGRDWGLEDAGLRGLGVQGAFPFDTVRLHPRTYPQRSATRRAAGVADQLEQLLEDIPFDRVAYNATTQRPFLAPQSPEHRIRDREVTVFFYNDRSYEWFMDETDREWGRVQVR